MSSVMTCLAIDGHVALLMTAETIIHADVDDPFCRGLLGHIAVAGRARHVGADMRCVIEPHVSVLAVIVNARPGNVFPARANSREFLNFRLFSGDHQMTGHAEFGAGHYRIGAHVGACMAIQTFETVSEMGVVRKGDGLYGLRSQTQEITQRRDC